MADKLRIGIRHCLLVLVVLVQVLSPVGVLAEELPPADTPSTEGEVQSPPAEVVSEPVATAPEPEPTPGPQQPTGADANTYVYNEATGLWENEHYTWDPVTKQTKPKVAPEFSYNPTTGQWDTTEWYYSPEQGKYLPNTVSAASVPMAMSMAEPAANTITETGPDSNNTITNDGTTTGIFDLFFDATISNKIGQMSRSGHASVQGNTTAGSATSGDATALANILNMIQSNWGGLGSEDLAVFLANVDGDLVGDLYVDPSALTRSGNTDLDVTVSSDAAIHNDIDVDVASGNALVNNNTSGGDATSGKAQAVVNLLNLINSAITSNKSFIGVLNINGNLNGDILLPPSMLNAIIAATGQNSNNQINSGGNTVIDATVVDNKAINNNINTAASSGNAEVTNNTSAGSAKSGKADTNVVLLNLTGKRVVAKNALLVFVNVMGSWVGLIFDAPAGTNAVAATGPGSNNTITDTGNLTVETDVTTNSLIDNDIDVAARSGDAEVSGNTNGGNATSGDASVGVNVLNMIDSQFEVSDWFGVLFINVFGNWVGSFGVNTSAGNQHVAVTSANSPPAGTTAGPAQSVGVFSFVPYSSAGTTQFDATETTTTSGGTEANARVAAAVLPSDGGSSGGGSVSPSTSSGSGLWIAALATLMGALMLGGERLITLIRSRQIA